MPKKKKVKAVVSGKKKAVVSKPVGDDGNEKNDVSHPPSDQAGPVDVKTAEPTTVEPIVPSTSETKAASANSSPGKPEAFADTGSELGVSELGLSGRTNITTTTTDDEETTDDAPPAAPSYHDPYALPAFLRTFPPDIGQPIRDLAGHVARLRQPIGTWGEYTFDGFDLEFKYLESLEARRAEKLTFTAAALEPNQVKNRYLNILPPDHSRVKLTVLDDNPCSDFINANFIDGLIPGSKGQYISTQGPLDETFADFWRMVWEKNVSVLFMLTREIEMGFLKCARYWPFGGAGDDDDDDDGYVAVTDEGGESGGNDGDGKPKPAAPPASAPISRQYGGIRVTLGSGGHGDEFEERPMTLTRLSDGSTRTLVQFQYTGWPDHGVPASVNGFNRLVAYADSKNHTAGPILVHCSAGVGRSGTFCTVHASLQKFKFELDQGLVPSFNILETVFRMRAQRPGFVQTKEQYMFCYLSLLDQSQRYLAEHEARRAALMARAAAAPGSPARRHPQAQPRPATSSRRRKKGSSLASSGASAASQSGRGAAGASSSGSGVGGGRRGSHVSSRRARPGGSGSAQHTPSRSRRH